jgi:hypothetical protein
VNDPDGLAAIAEHDHRWDLDIADRDRAIYSRGYESGQSLSMHIHSRDYESGRSLSIDMWNPIVAAPLLRMQIDSLMRISYTARMANSDEIAMYVINGGEFRRLKDAEGKRLIDRRLLEHAAPAHPWIGGVYEATSAWVHLSPEHLRASIPVSDDGEAEGERRGAATFRGVASMRISLNHRVRICRRCCETA